MIGPAGFMAAPKRDTVDAGDLAEYQAKARSLAGRACMVHATTAKRVYVIVRGDDGRLLRRHVKSQNLKRLVAGLINED